MKICMIADLHLPETEGAVQYRVLDWALSDVKKKNADLIVFVGDYTANGSYGSIDRFRNAIQKLDTPVMIITGNSDLRMPETSQFIRSLESSPIFLQDDVKIIGLMDGDGCISEEIYELLGKADQNTIVCAHHPIQSLRQVHRDRMNIWRSAHPEVPFFYGHLHISEQIGEYTWSLPAADPDKAIGGYPSIVYYDTDTKKLQNACYDCPVPSEFKDWLGISCMRPLSDIPYATAHRIPHIELRNSAVVYQRELLPLLEQWRASGGKTLSVHAPEIVSWEQESLKFQEWNTFVAFCKDISADRITLHVPNIPVYAASDSMLKEIAEFVAQQLEVLPNAVVIGVENMHMTEKDRPDDSRRFGYLPEEVLRFVNILKAYTTYPVGTHLDVGHARNNAPYSQHYPISSWYRSVGPDANGYHIHQVLLTEHGMENHMPIDNWYGCLISYASFFRDWVDGTLKKGPVFLEIRPDRGYEVTFALLGK